MLKRFNDNPLSRGDSRPALSMSDQGEFVPRMHPLSPKNTTHQQNLKRTYLARASLALKLKDLEPKDMSAQYVQRSMQVTNDDIIETERKVLNPMTAAEGSSRPTGPESWKQEMFNTSGRSSGHHSPRREQKIRTNFLRFDHKKAVKVVNLDTLSKSQCNALKSTRFQNRSRSTLATLPAQGIGSVPMSPNTGSTLHHYPNASPLVVPENF